jgi:hypothetical protein
MKITGDKHWPYQAIIDAHGVKQIYTMPTEEKFHGFLEATKQRFPFVKITITQFGEGKEQIVSSCQ